MSKEETGSTENAQKAPFVDSGVADAREVGHAPRPRLKAHVGRGSEEDRKPKSILRAIYWVLWFLILPFVLACVLVWALTPPSGVEHGGIVGWMQGWVREQPVPMGIISFTLFEMALWAVRHRLPLSFHANPPLRADLPRSVRRPFESARALLEEADAILEKHRDAIVRDFPLRERDKLRADLDALARAMEAEPFDEDAFVDALVAAEGEVDVRLGRFRKSEVREYAESIFIAIAVALALRAFVVEAFKIPSGSMIPTLQVGDHIFVNKFTYGLAIPWTHERLWSRMPPERGDVIVFAYPEHPEQDFIKRVIAVPGDKLEARGGHPVINGWEVPSCNAGTYSYFESQDGMRHEGTLFVEFLEDEAYLTLYDHSPSSSDYQGPFYVKPGEVYVMGDNRNNSHDSRMWWGGQGGGVPFDNIRGRALFVWLSVGSQFDWSRIFAPVMGRPPAHGPFGAMPDAMHAAEPAIEQCLRNRPPLDRTRPAGQRAP
ncbi:MAG: signal peptidase I [Polyangiaceae bacterium]|nr:signal peptidase I [Polyangiaceae bacterium]